MNNRLTEIGLKPSKHPLKEFDHTFGFMVIPWFGKNETVPVIIERVSKEDEPNDAQIEALCKFAEYKDIFFAELPQKLYAYYLQEREESSFDDETTAELFPELGSEAELSKLVSIPTIMVSYYDGSTELDYLALMGDCSWEIEHGLGIRIVDNHIVEIGMQDCVI